MGGIGPMAGQVHHFKNYAVETLTYAINRYVNEVNRLYGVMNLRLKDRDFIAGKYSIADMAIVGWANGWERQGQDINEFPNLKALARAHEGAPGGQARHGARPRAAPGHRYEGSQSPGGAVWAARQGRLVRARPLLRLAEHAEHAALDVGGIAVTDRHVGAVGIAVVGVIDAA